MLFPFSPLRLYFILFPRGGSRSINLNLNAPRGENLKVFSLVVTHPHALAHLSVCYSILPLPFLSSLSNKLSYLFDLFAVHPTDSEPFIEFLVLVSFTSPPTAQKKKSRLTRHYIGGTSIFIDDVDGRHRFHPERQNNVPSVYERLFIHTLSIQRCKHDRIEKPSNTPATIILDRCAVLPFYRFILYDTLALSSIGSLAQFRSFHGQARHRPACIQSEATGRSY